MPNLVPQGRAARVGLENRERNRELEGDNSSLDVAQIMERRD